jgi:hypothetical protein
MIHSFKEFRRKYKGKEICFLSKLVRVPADSMMKPQSSMDIGETFFSELKGRRKEGDQRI